MKLYVSLCAALVTTDQLLKHVLPTPGWGWDPKGFSVAALFLGVGSAAVLAAYPPTRLGGTIMLAGICSNAFSASRGPVANPFVVNDVAFNAADTMLFAGLLIIFASMPSVYRDIHAREKRKRWVL